MKNLRCLYIENPTLFRRKKIASEISAEVAQIIVDGSIAHLPLIIASALRIVHGTIHGAEGILPSLLKFDDVVADVLVLNGFHLCDSFPLFDPGKEQFQRLLIAQHRLWTQLAAMAILHVEIHRSL